jgi:diguanylate cyclase (GGDEF)-like protein
MWGIILEKVYSFINNRLKENRIIKNDANLININRVYYLSIILIPLIIINLLIMIYKHDHYGGSDIYWHLLMGIHFYLMIVLPIFTYFANKFRRSEKSNKDIEIIITVFVVKILLVGIIITTLDQMLTNSITVYFMTAVLVAAVFNIRPTLALSYYLLLIVVVLLLLSRYQPNKDIFISHIMEVISAGVISYAISFITWKNTKLTILQNRKIEEQQKELEVKNSKLSNIAFYDHMTSLYNRRKIDQIIDQELKVLKNKKFEYSIIILDLDNFKMVNDKYGHPVGDKILIELSGLLERNTRATDSVGRWGGEEFIILLPFTHKTTAKSIAEKLRCKIENHRFEIEGMSIYITASFGVSELDDSYKKKSYQKADKALYMAKKERKNCVVVYN